MKSLTHNGVLIPKPFESKGFDNINGVKISLLAEEMLWKYAPYAINRFKDDSIFIDNVWIDLKPQLPKELQDKKFPNYFMDTLVKMNVVSKLLKLKKQENDKLNKKEIESNKAETKNKYGYCVKDGKKTEISNFMVEGSRWFVSRGNLRGRWVSSVQAEDVEINSSENIPCTQEGHSWKRIKFCDTDYIASYKINVGFGKVYIDKFVWISATSKNKQKDNERKYEKARKLLLKIDDIEKKVLKDVKLKDKLKRENALITYIVLTYGIRIGNDLGEDNFRDKNVRGASTLRAENIILEGNNKMHLEFIGKDSIPYCETKEIDKIVYDAFIELIKNKKPSDKIYDLATSSTVNAYLKSIYHGDITIKSFRTAKGSGLLANEIQKREWKNLTDKEFKNNLMECCLQTSLLLNHHKTVTEEQIEKANKSAENKIESAKNALKKIKESAEKKLAKLKKDKKDFKDCLEGKLLEEKLNEIKFKEKELKEKISNAEKKYEDILKEVEFKIFSQSINLSTSLNNYSQPKLLISLCKYANKNPNIIYSKAQLKKFEWAMNVDTNYWKKYPNV